MDHTHRVVAINKLRELLDSLASEAAAQSREIHTLKEKITVLTKDLEENWKEIQKIRKQLVTEMDTFLTPVPLPKEEIPNAGNYKV